MSQPAQVLESDTGGVGKRTAATKQRICDVAARQFNRESYGAVSMESIALEAGVARSTIYRLFVDKEDVARHVVTPVFDLAREILLEIDTEKPELILNGIAQSYLEIWATRKEALLFASHIDQSLYPVVRKAHDAYAQTICDLMDKIHEARMLRNDNPRSSAVLLARTATSILGTYEKDPQFENLFCHTLRGMLLKW